MQEMSEIKVVRELAALSLAHGITRWVVAPGSRNAPIVCTLSAIPGMELRPVTDERSAGFVALGWAAQAQAPVGVCVTSGSAALNLHPAAAEAFYRHLPVVFVTADRPAAAIGQQEGQTLPQQGIFGTLVRYSANVPEEDMAFANRLINEAFLELNHHDGGPVHLNVPLSEPLFKTSTEPLHKPRVIRRAHLTALPEKEREDILLRAAAAPRKMILLGQLPAPAHALAALRQQGWVVLGEHICNTSGIQNRPDEIICSEPAADLRPDLLVTYGGCLVSKRLQRFLKANPPSEHWHLSGDGMVTDTYGCQTLCLEGSEQNCAALLSQMPAAAPEWQQLWHREMPEFSGPCSGMSLVGELLHRIPVPCVLHLANSSAVRFAQLFTLPEGVQVECNRGVNGIEGSLSTAIGYAAADERPQFIICGDLSFFYDMNALWQEALNPRLRILLLNNGGGGIFSTLPGMPVHPHVHGNHRTKACSWAASCGFRAMEIHSSGDISEAMELLTGETDTPVLAEAFTDSETDAELLRNWYSRQA